MTHSAHPTAAPLNVGNVVTTTVQLYRARFSSYLKIAFFGYITLILITLAAIAVSGLAVIQAIAFENDLSNVIVAVGLIAAGIAGLIYASAKLLAAAGAISRLAFRELVGQPEEIAVAQQYTNDRLWSFWRVGIEISLRLGVIYLGLVMIASLVGGFLAVAVGFFFAPLFQEGGSVSPLAFVAAFFLGAIGILGLISMVLIPLVWFFSRWIVAEVPLAVEEGVNGAQSIARSWSLTQGSVGRIQWVVVVAFLVSSPIVGITNYLPQLLSLAVDPESGAGVVITLVSFLTSYIGGMFLLPFWQILKAVIYFDLRNRREGLGLELRS